MAALKTILINAVAVVESLTKVSVFIYMATPLYSAKFPVLSVNFKKRACQIPSFLYSDSAKVLSYDPFN
jgi:hypothetical protein